MANPVFEVPNWALFRSANVHKGGFRWPKRSAVHDAHPHAWPTHKKYSWASTYPVMNNTRAYNGPPDLKENWLSQGDFRCWCGSETLHSYGACRVCAEVISIKNHRVTHRRLGCGHRLEQALKLLKRDPVCVICGDPTHQKRYGIPICSKDCQHHWQYVETRPAALIEAFKLLAAKT